MKKIYYHENKAQITIGDGKPFQATVKEFEFELFPTKKNTAIHQPIPMNNQTLNLELPDISFTGKLELNEAMREWLKPQPFYHQITLQINGFIQEETKKAMFECQEKGMLFHLRFRQMIHPKLIHEITFLTILESKQYESI